MEEWHIILIMWGVIGLFALVQILGAIAYHGVLNFKWKFWKK